jgi:hypothetical protein
MEGERQVQHEPPHVNRIGRREGIIGKHPMRAIFEEGGRYPSRAQKLPHRIFDLRYQEGMAVMKS